MIGAWPRLLGGLIAWAAHFLVLYVLGEVEAAPVWVWVATAVALGANAALVVAVRAPAVDTAFDGWRRWIALAGIGISTLAVVWQSLPAAL